MTDPTLKIVVIGRSGQLASELNQLLPQKFQAACLGRPEINFDDLEGLRAALRRLQPSVLINAAAYTAVDQAESESAAANRANAEAPAAMAEEAAKQRALFISYSTDYVFDGEKSSAYYENDEPRPLNVYGSSKLVGERAVQAVGGAYLMLRTSWVFGARGNNFLNTILRVAGERTELRVVNDQIGAPTWSRELAKATEQMVSQLAAEAVASRCSVAEVLSERRGIYHVTGGGSVSWCGFATAIIEERLKRRGEAGPLARVTPIPSYEYSTPARRPRNSRLCNEKLQRVFGIALPHWRESLCAVMDEMAVGEKMRR